MASTKKPRALVTGGAGFLGSHLCERLLAEGYRVVCMDNLRTGSLENVAHFQGDSDFDYIDHDTTSYIHLPGELDEIYHFASPASPADFERIPIPILKVGALGTLNSLGLALKKGGSIWQGSGAATRTGKSGRTAAQLRGSLSRWTHSRLASRNESCPRFE